MACLRLNYAAETRYGILVDLAQKVLAGQPIDVTMGHFNTIWQADASAMALRSFEHVSSPPFVVNVAGPELLSIRCVADEFGRLLERPVTVQGSEASDAFLSNGQRGFRLFGYPRVSAKQLVHWVADWVKRAGTTLGRPTHFEVRHGDF
jgi:hypothetical protein